MDSRLKPIAEACGTYLTEQWEQPCRVVEISQIPGGASRETYRLKIEMGDVEGGTQDHTPNTRGLIVRRDPPSSLIDTERSLEFNTYKAVFEAGVMPVPEPLILEEEAPGDLLRPFSIMAEIPTGQASPAGLDAPGMQAALPALGQRKWSLLGQLARTPIETLGVDAFMPVPEHAAKRELDYWTQVIREDSLKPQPVAEATIRWLNKHLPAPTKTLRLVHGDYRTGNFMYDDSGEITAVLDWEMAHIGDPLEDLAWSLDPLWSAQPEIAGRLLPRREAASIWQSASGITIDPEAFKWWQVFASLKALAIWTSSNEDYVNGTTKEPILAMAGWPMMDRETRFLVDRLSGDNKFLYAEPITQV